MLLDSCQRVGATFAYNETRGASKGAPRRRFKRSADVGCQPCRPHVARGIPVHRAPRRLLTAPRTASGIPRTAPSGTCGSLTPVSRSIVAALTGLSAVGASTTVGNAAAPPRATLPETGLSCATWILQCSLPSGRMNETRHPDVPRLLLQTSCPALPRRGPSTYPRSTRKRGPVPGPFHEPSPRERVEHSKGKPARHAAFRTVRTGLSRSPGSTRVKDSNRRVNRVFERSESIRCCSRNYLLSFLSATHGLEPVRSTALPHAQHMPPRAEREPTVRLRRESSRADTSERERMARTTTPTASRRRGEHDAPTKRPRASRDGGRQRTHRAPRRRPRRRPTRCRSSSTRRRATRC